MRKCWIDGISNLIPCVPTFSQPLFCINPILAGNRFAEPPNCALGDQSHPTKTCPAQKQLEFNLPVLKHLHPQVHAWENTSHLLHSNEPSLIETHTNKAHKKNNLRAAVVQVLTYETLTMTYEGGKLKMQHQAENPCWALPNREQAAVLAPAVTGSWVLLWSLLCLGNKELPSAWSLWW